jgi:molecular chaperone DnaK
VRNNADSLAYQVERQLSQFGSSIPVHEKARVEQLVTDLRQALKENADIEKIRTLTSDLQQAAYSLSEAAYRKEQTAGRPTGGEDVVDAEFEEK